MSTTHFKARWKKAISDGKRDCIRQPPSPHTISFNFIQNSFICFQPVHICTTHRGPKTWDISARWSLVCSQVGISAWASPRDDLGTRCRRSTSRILSPPTSHCSSAPIGSSRPCSRRDGTWRQRAISGSRRATTSVWGTWRSDSVTLGQSTTRKVVQHGSWIASESPARYVETVGRVGLPYWLIAVRIRNEQCGSVCELLLTCTSL